MALGRSKQQHVKNYRISCCVMAGVPGRRSDLVFFFDQLRGGGGLMVAGNVIRGNLESSKFISPLLTGEYLSEGAAREWSTVVDISISIPSPSFKPVSLSLSRISSL